MEIGSMDGRSMELDGWMDEELELDGWKIDGVGWRMDEIELLEDGK